MVSQPKYIKYERLNAGIYIALMFHVHLGLEIKLLPFGSDPGLVS